MLGKLIGGFVVILVGVNLLPTIADAVVAAQKHNSRGGASGTSNVGGASSTIIGLVTLFYGIGVMAIGISLAIGGLQDAGLM